MTEVRSATIPEDSSDSSASLSDQEKTIIKTLHTQILEAISSDETSSSSKSAELTGSSEMRSGINENTRPSTKEHNDAPQVSVGSSGGSTSSSYKRYKFGLTNHFLTMPDANAQPGDVRAYYQRAAHQHSPTTSKSSKSRREQKRNKVLGASPALNQDDRLSQADDRLATESDDNCDLSVLAPSLPDVSSLLSDENEDHNGPWPRLGYNPETASQHNTTQSSDGDSSSKILTGKKPRGKGESEALSPKTSTARHRLDAADRGVLPAGDAGLDAGRCNSRAKNSDYYLSPSAYHLAQAELVTEASKFGNGIESLAAGNKHLKQQPHLHHRHDEDDDDDDDDPDPLRRHHLKKKRKLNGEPEDSASNGLLLKFSSIMYATFLVILGCILHVSELKQKSRNSSDHIYTTVVASVGILWLIFLQSDLQRYKKYASKFILLETIFNDHHNQQRRRGMGSANDILLGLDPTSRSTSSSSASLVNDRMSMNTEVIFKKTAYKMYQHHAAAADKHYADANLSPQGHYVRNAHRTPYPASSSPSVSVEPLDSASHHSHHHHHHRHQQQDSSSLTLPLIPAYKFLHGKMGANFYLKCGMAAFCFGHVIHEGLRFGQQVYFFATNNVACRDSAALVAHLVTPLYSFYQLFMMFKYSNLVINRHKILARFGLMHIIGTCVTFWFRTILEEAFEDFVHKMDYFKSQNKPINHHLDPTHSLRRDLAPHRAHEDNARPASIGLLDWLNSITASESSSNLLLANLTGPLPAGPSGQAPVEGQNLTLAQSALLALMSSPLSATITPQLVRHLPDSYHCAQNTLLTTKSMNALPYLYPFTIEYNLLIAATFLSLYFNIGKVGAAARGMRCYLSCCQPGGGSQSELTSALAATSKQPSSSGASFNGSPHRTALDLMSEHQSGTGNALSASRYHSTGSQQQQLQHHHHHHYHSHHQPHHHLEHLQAGEYKSNFVVNADCHAANKGLFLGFFVLLVTLVTIVIFFVTINKPSHLQLGIKINLIQEATLTSLILIVTLAGYRQIMRLTRNPFIKDKVTTDDVLMLIPLPFFFIHSLLSFRAETATLYAAQHQLSGSLLLSQAQHQKDAPTLSAAETAARVLKLETANQSVSSLAAEAGGRADVQRAPAPRRTDFLLTMPGGLALARAAATQSAQSSDSANKTTRPGGATTATATTSTTTTTTNRRPNATSGTSSATTSPPQTKIDRFKLLTIVLNLAVMVEVLVQTNFIIDGLRRCSESRYLRFKKPGRELITFAILLNITYWIVATFETKSVEQYKTEIDYYGPLPYMFISHTTLPVMLFYRYHSSVCLAEIWNRAYKPPKRR